VKKVLGLFGSGREEDRLTGYLSFLKIGPQLLKFIPGRKARDLKSWLTVYGYWNQVRSSTLLLLTSTCLEKGAVYIRA
jgi:magnesium chelatase subunit H